MKRRAFFLLPLALSTVRLFAAPATSSRFLVVFLRGGYDAANVLVPVSSADYYEARRNIAIPKAAALPIDSDWGLHPALRDSLFPLYGKGELAIVPFAGTDNLSRSNCGPSPTVSSTTSLLGQCVAWLSIAFSLSIHDGCSQPECLPSPASAQSVWRSECE